MRYGFGVNMIDGKCMQAGKVRFRFRAFSEVQVMVSNESKCHGEGRGGANSFVALLFKHKKRKSTPQEKKNSASTFAMSTSVAKAGCKRK